MNNITCNVCGYNGELIAHRDSAKRKCPKCASLERHRNFFEYVSLNDSLLKDKIVLHISPEKVFNEFVRSRAKKYYSIDKNPLKPFVSKDDLTDLSVFNDNAFDSVICFHVLEHVLEDAKAIKEIKRVLKTNGIAFIAVPLINENPYTYRWTQEEIDKSKQKGEWGIIGRYDGHVRDYGHLDLSNLLRDNFAEVTFSNEKEFTPHDFFICKK